MKPCNLAEIGSEEPVISIHREDMDSRFLRNVANHQHPTWRHIAYATVKPQILQM
jgi:hypothetical protein